jgi:hypothetical protein
MIRNVQKTMSYYLIMIILRLVVVISNINWGCDCGISEEDENGLYDYSKLHLEHCLAS